MTSPSAQALAWTIGPLRAHVTIRLERFLFAGPPAWSVVNADAELAVDISKELD